MAARRSTAETVETCRSSIEMTESFDSCAPPMGSAGSAGGGRRVTSALDPGRVMQILQSGDCLGSPGHSRPLMPFRSFASYCKELVRPGILCSLLVVCLIVGWIKFALDPTFTFDGETQSELGAYATIFGLLLCVVMLWNGWQPWVVFTQFIVLLGVTGVMDKRQIIGGFSKDGAWIPQFMLVILTAISESGVLEEALSFFLGVRSVRRLGGRLGVFLRLQLGTAALAALVGAGPAVTVAVPLVTQWAKNEACDVGPPLHVSVISATCGSVMLFTSAPISIAIRDIMTRPPQPQMPISGTLPLALLIFAALSAYSLMSLPTSSRPAVQENESAEEPPAKAAPPAARLHYRLEFVVRAGSSVVGLTPAKVGLAPSSGVELLHLCRPGFPMARSRSCLLGSEQNRRTSVAANTLVEWQREASEPSEMDNWVFEVGDVLVCQCSVQGIIYVRRQPGVFALRGLHCNELLGGRRYMRRLFECVLAAGSPLAGETLESLLGLQQLESLGSHEDQSEVELEVILRNLETVECPPFLKQHLGYPLGAFRRSASGPEGVQPLGLTDALAPGDVLLVDAFEDFPKLEPTRRDFLVVALVPDSQAPRHGRRFDRIRGIGATVLLLGIVVSIDIFRYPLVLGTLTGAVLCVATRTVHVSEVLRCLNWPMLLTFGAGTAVSEAVVRTGVGNFLLGAMTWMGGAMGTVGTLLAVSLGAQITANVLGNVAAGLIVAPLALELAVKDRNLMPVDLCVLVAISCNMTLSTPFAGSNTAIRGASGLSPRHFLRFGLPAQAIVTFFAVGWTYLTSGEKPSSTDVEVALS